MIPRSLNDVICIASRQGALITCMALTCELWFIGFLAGWGCWLPPTLEVCIGSLGMLVLIEEAFRSVSVQW